MDLSSSRIKSRIRTTQHNLALQKAKILRENSEVFFCGAPQTIVSSLCERVPC